MEFKKIIKVVGEVLTNPKYAKSLAGLIFLAIFAAFLNSTFGSSNIKGESSKTQDTEGTTESSETPATVQTIVPEIPEDKIVKTVPSEKCYADLPSEKIRTKWKVFIRSCDNPNFAKVKSIVLDQDFGALNNDDANAFRSFENVSKVYGNPSDFSDRDTILYYREQDKGEAKGLKCLLESSTYFDANFRVRLGKTQSYQDADHGILGIHMRSADCIDDLKP